MNVAYLLLGSNIEPRLTYIENALHKLAGRLTIIKRSSLYETAAWGMPAGTHSFLNMVAEVETKMLPAELLEYCLQCEIELGRIRTIEVSSRTIDIDILLFGNQIIQSGGLVIPHPRLHLRRFTLMPLAEIAGDIIHPVLKKSIGELLKECTDKSEVKLITRLKA